MGGNYKASRLKKTTGYDSWNSYASSAAYNPSPLRSERVAGNNKSWSPRLYSYSLSGIFGETRRAYSAEVASATKAGSMSSFAKASEDTRCAFLHGLAAVASCVGG
jgi:hypothetical protein